MTLLIPAAAAVAVAAMLATLHAATRLPDQPDAAPTNVGDWPTQTIPAVGHSGAESPLVRPYVRYGRHAADTASLRRVPADWTPPVGAGRLRAALDDTAQMPAVRVDVLRDQLTQEIHQ